MVCNCKKKNCPRHGKCEECIAYHKTAKREPYCLRKGSKKRKALITFCVIVGLGILAAIAVFSTMSILSNQYKHVQEMVINDISASHLQNGDFEGEYAYGKNTYSVNVTVMEGEIAHIDLAVDTKDSNQKYVDKASALVDDVISSQSLQVDCISGATRSSKSILKAVENALSQAD
jgi:uncharacterized protein with FMN-binding domain